MSPRVDTGLTHEVCPIERIERPVLPEALYCSGATKDMAIGPHEVDPVVCGVSLLKMRDTDGKGMLTGSAAVEGILAAAERAVLGQADTVLDAVTILYQGANLGICLSSEGYNQGTISQAL